MQLYGFSSLSKIHGKGQLPVRYFSKEKKKKVYLTHFLMWPIDLFFVQISKKCLDNK